MVKSSSLWSLCKPPLSAKFPTLQNLYKHLGTYQIVLNNLCKIGRHANWYWTHRRILIFFFFIFCLLSFVTSMSDQLPFCCKTDVWAFTRTRYQK
jgi:hypothetical protein